MACAIATTGTRPHRRASPVTSATMAVDVRVRTVSEEGEVTSDGVGDEW